MRIKKPILVGLCATTFFTSAFAGKEHVSTVYQTFNLEIGLGGTDDGAGIAHWDFDGWIGTDENKLKLKSKGERENGVTNQAEFWATYSHKIDTFWDVQIGIRQDTQPDLLTYGVIGLEGLAPYFFETESHLFVSEDGDVSVRIRHEKEFLISQKLIAQPYVEANLFAQDVPELEVGSGLSNAEFGLQTRYEFTRSFAPYIDVKYERKFGDTSSIAKNNSEAKDAVVGTIGVKWMF
ncbi:MAG: copper resistance protein B [Opitutae bacterium]|nr:copper resistance protein B [Opitutae bacterium]